MHTGSQSSVCTDLHMSLGTFLLLDLYMLKMKDNTGALQTVKAPMFVQTSHPDHSTLLTFGLWKKQLCRNFQIPDHCSKHI